MIVSGRRYPRPNGTGASGTVRAIGQEMLKRVSATPHLPPKKDLILPSSVFCVTKKLRPVSMFLFLLGSFKQEHIKFDDLHAARIFKGLFEIERIFKVRSPLESQI